jgi:hypothetical protein
VPDNTQPYVEVAKNIILGRLARGTEDDLKTNEGRMGILRDSKRPFSTLSKIHRTLAPMEFGFELWAVLALLFCTAPAEQTYRAAGIIYASLEASAPSASHGA